MKAILSILGVFLLLAITGIAQPVITGANIIKVGDWYRTQKAATQNVTAGDTGANRIWNYGALVDQIGAVGIDSFTLPGNFPVPPIFGSPNLMTYSRYTTGAATDSSHNFFALSGDTLRVKGYYLPTDTSTVLYQKPIIFFPYFPFTYGHSCADSSFLFFNNNNTSFDTAFLNFNFTVTGYGTLTLPGNRTFNNVLQIRRYTQQIMDLDTFQNIFEFYQTPGNPFPLLEIQIFDGTVESIQYMTNYYTAPVGPTYTFTGNGNWNNPANWQGGIIPPGSLVPGASIIISHAPGGSCIINVPVTIPPGVQFIVSAGANLVLPGNLTIL